MPNMTRMKALLNPLVRVPASTRTAGPVAAEAVEARRTSAAVRLARWRLATDVLMLVIAGTVEALSASAADVSDSPGWRLAFIALVLAALGLRGVYRARVGQRFLDEARTVLSATAVAAMLVTFVRVAVDDNPAVAEEAIRTWVFAAVYLIGGRAILAMVNERFNRLGHGARTLILGAGQVGHLVARRLLAHPELGLRPIGFVDADPLEVERPSGLPVLGSQDDLERVVRAYRVEHAIVSFSNAPHDTQLGISRALQRMRISVSIIPRLFEGVPDKIALERVGGLPLVTIYPSDPRDWRVSVKYASDRVIALLAIVVLSPLLLLAAAGTVLTLGRPLLFRQRRVGLDGHEFEMLKFRTMRFADPEEQERSAREVEQAIDKGLAPGGHEGAERWSRFGALLRGTGFDELPQFFNVLNGEMSMVGPRPERPSYVAKFEHRIRRYSDRHQVKAGITGWAQVHGLRGDTSIEDRIEWDNYYIENWSPWLDLKILLLTLLTPFRRSA
jgi:exopolysaccharide biosynthesis polyprenyl glycosylphosphotransferase